MEPDSQIVIAEDGAVLKRTRSLPAFHPFRPPCDFTLGAFKGSGIQAK
jgi:hypothetical protein